MKKFKIYIFLIAMMLFACNENTKKIDNPIEKFQSDLIAEGTTGSNVAKVFKNGVLDSESWKNRAVWTNIFAMF